MQKQYLLNTLFLMLAICLSACATRTSPALENQELRLAALEEKVYNYQEKQEGINDWTAKRLTALETKHPDVKVAPPPVFMQRETVRVSEEKPAMSGGVTETMPGEAHIAPGEANQNKIPNQNAQISGAPSATPIAQADQSTTTRAPEARTAELEKPGKSTPTVNITKGQPTDQSTQQPKREQAQSALPQTGQPQAGHPNTQTEQAAVPNQKPAGASQKPMDPAATGTPATEALPTATMPPARTSPLEVKPSTTSAPKATPEPKTAPKGTATSAGDKGTYAAALSLLERGKSEEGRLAMESFLEKYPDSSLAPNAIYWKGEAYYSQHKFEDSIITFKDVVNKHPKSNKAADALLKIGMSYQKLGDVENAKFYLQMLLDDYPSTRSAALAKKQITALK